MTTTTSVTAAAGDAWTLLHTAAGAETIGVQNRSNDTDLLVRVGTSTAVGDDPQAAAELLNPGEFRAITLATGNKVHVRPRGTSPVMTTLRA